MNPVKLGVNIDHVATLRQVRLTRYPDPVQAAFLAEQAGADLITVHLREDRRHILDRDVLLLRQTLLTPLNLEMAVTGEMLGIAEQVRPDYCCLVPERREELTTEGGLDVVGRAAVVREACTRLAAAGIRVSLFIDPDPAQIEAAAEAGAGAVELHTGGYSDAADPASRIAELGKIAAGVDTAHGLGLVVNAGHGLNYQNVGPVAALAAIEELNIGHSIIARAVFTGLPEAVREMKQLMLAARS